MDWTVILAYACFGLGALFILIGLVRITYYGCAVRRDKRQRKKIQSFYNFSSHKSDPWLKSNPLVTNRLEASGRLDSDSLRDLDVQRFTTSEDGGSLTESQQGTTERDVQHVYHSIPDQTIVYGREMQLDSDTLTRNARYEEPNTNLVLAKKHQQPDNLQEILNTATAQQVTPTPHSPHSPTPPTPEPSPDYPKQHTDLRLHIDTHIETDYQEATIVMNGEPASARSLDTREAFEALDFATAGESIATPRSDYPLEDRESPSLSESQEGSKDTATVVTGSTITVPSTPGIIANIAGSNEPLPAGDEMEYHYEHAVTSF